MASEEHKHSQRNPMKIDKSLECKRDSGYPNGTIDFDDPMCCIRLEDK